MAVTWVMTGPPSWPDSGYDPNLHIGHCKRCGALVAKPELPAMMEDVIDYLNDATDSHVDCVEKEQPAQAEEAGR